MNGFIMLIWYPVTDTSTAALRNSQLELLKPIWLQEFAFGVRVSALAFQ